MSNRTKGFNSKKTINTSITKNGETIEEMHEKFKSEGAKINFAADKKVISVEEFINKMEEVSLTDILETTDRFGIRLNKTFQNENILYTN